MRNFIYMQYNPKYKFHFTGQIVRVYPSGMRIDSSNFNPITMWSCGIQMVAMNYQTVTDANLHLHNSFFAGTQGYILKPAVMWNTSHILYERFLPASKTQEGLHVTHVSLTIVSGQYVCRENYSASPLVEVEVNIMDIKENYYDSVFFRRLDSTFDFFFMVGN